MALPLVSIIIPCWQTASTIKRVLSAIYSQTYPSLEVVVIDDGSTDGLASALALFSDRLTLIRFSENYGAPHARNVGLERSHGELVMFLDADLILKKQAVSKLVTALGANPEASFAYPSFRWDWKLFRSGEWNPLKLQERNYIHTSALIRRQAEPHFDETLKRFQDWDLWLTFAERGQKGVWVPETLYRILPRRKGLGMSSWMPSGWYRFPWEKIGFVPKGVRQYREAARLVLQKHHLI